jgi:hypothetical protein
MKNTKRRAALCLVISTLLVSASAMADDGKEYIGSLCSFADNPLASHNRINHVFKNTSGVSQWITCPLVRETGNNIQYAAIEFNTTPTNVRLEIRYDNAGSLAGWNYYGTTNLGGTNVEYFWFDGSTTGAASSGAVLAIEAYLPNNAYVYKYNMTEVT